MTIAQVPTTPLAPSPDPISSPPQISLSELSSNQKGALSPYWKAIRRMYTELGGCLDELEEDSAPRSHGSCFALFHISRLQIVAVAIVEQVPIEILSLEAAVKEEGGDERSGHLCVSPGCALCPSPTLGIRQMWVRPEHRGRGIIFSLVEIGRRKTFPRLMIPRSHVAFSQPTRDGKKFIARYTDSAPQYWVYSSGSTSSR